MASLIESDPATAVRVLSELGELLRRSVDTGQGSETTIDEEFAFLERYVDITQHRFGDRVTVRIHRDRGIESAVVPVLTLQPLVENAYLHGVGPKATPGLIEVVARKAFDRIELSVTDDGVGEARGAADAKSSGVALRNLRRRLPHLYADTASLVAAGLPEGGFRAVVSVPHVAPEDRPRVG